ncbi:protein KAKU4 [Pistacia vera]|uniref:protein KAKU4 n=1 Tax=Pistacia vera TaxID=55513 RepID=UPI001263DAB9|nr:protein KAKU4 [Pistacia vera]
MASTSRPRRLAEPRSGGKMVRLRRSAANRTPYDRPALSPNPTPQNPNWLSKFIYSPTRLIATGAGKLLSSVFTGESSASSSSSSEDDSDDSDNEISSQTTDSIKKKRALEVIQHPSEPQYLVEKSETKYLIERLIMQVTFSREEFNRLKSIIKSRVVDSPIFGDAEDRRLSDLSNRTAVNDVDMPDLCNAAVSEAKKWLEEKKLGSNSKSDLELGTCTLNSAMLPHGSEVKWDSPASGSWDITEELRKFVPALTSENRSAVKSTVADKVEATTIDKVLNSTKSVDASLNLVTGVTTSYGLPVSQVTQDLLQSEPLPPNQASFFSEQNKLHTKDLEDVQTIEATREGRPSSEQRLQPPEEFNIVLQSFKVHKLVLVVLKLILHIYTLVFGKVNCHFSSVILCLCICLSDAGTANVDGIKDTNGTTQLCDSKISGNAQDAGLHDQNCSASKEIAGKGGSFTPNGFPPSGSCLSTGQDREQNDQPSDAKQNPVGSGHDKVTPGVPRGETCAFLSEASVEVPVTCEINSTNTGSENSSSMPSEEFITGRD